MNFNISDELFIQKNKVSPLILGDVYRGAPRHICICEPEKKEKKFIHEEHALYDVIKLFYGGQLAWPTEH